MKKQLSGNIEKTWHVNGPRDAEGLDVHGLRPHYYLYRTDRDPGSAEYSWIHLLGDCQPYGYPADVRLPDGRELFRYSTATGHLSNLVKDKQNGRCFLVKEDRSIWQVIDFEFDAARLLPALILIKRRQLHAKREVTQLAFNEGPEDDLARLAQKLSDAELSWSTVEGSHIAKAELERRLLKPSSASEAERDAVTDLGTRRHMETYLRDVRQRPAAFPLGLVFLDIDHFKQVNDTRGHEAGDRALRAVASQAGMLAYPHGSAFRYGGEEILVVRENCDLEGAKSVGEQVRRAVARTQIPHDAEQFSVTASVGVACASSAAEVDEALRRADAAMYEAKKAGRNQVLAK